MNELSLFTGAGGGLLGSILLGWKTIGAVEIEKYPCKVLEARQKDGVLDAFPIWNMDIREFNKRIAPSYKGVADVITAGPPCQPFSVAGKRKAEQDERNMWPYTIRCIQIIRPKYVFLENVPGLLSAKSQICVCSRANRWRRAYWDTKESWSLLLNGNNSWHGRQSETPVDRNEERVWRNGFGHKEEHRKMVFSNKVAYWRGISDSIPSEDIPLSHVEERTGSTLSQSMEIKEEFRNSSKWNLYMDRESQNGSRKFKAEDAQPESERSIRCQQCGRLVQTDANIIRYVGTIYGDLAEAGYNARWCVLGADDVGAPHRRKRWWLFAYAESA